MRQADRIHVMEDGRIVESGDYETLMESHGRFTEIQAAESV